jgi:hypothetical protein
MTMTKPEEGGAVDVDALSAMVTKQGSLVRQLKKVRGWFTCTSVPNTV